MWNGAKTGAFPGSPGLINYFWMERHGRWHTSILQELMLAIVVTKDWRALRRGKDVSFKRQQLSETTWDRWDLINLPLLLATLASTVYPTQGSILPQLGLHCLFLFHVGLCFHSPTSTQKPLKVSLTCTMSSKLVPPASKFFCTFSLYISSTMHANTPFYWSWYIYHIGWSTAPVCPGRKGYPGHRIFGARTRKVLGKVERVGCPL